MYRERCQSTWSPGDKKQHRLHKNDLFVCTECSCTSIAQYIWPYNEYYGHEYNSKYLIEVAFEQIKQGNTNEIQPVYDWEEYTPCRCCGKTGKLFIEARNPEEFPVITFEKEGDLLKTDIVVCSCCKHRMRAPDFFTEETNALCREGRAQREAQIKRDRLAMVKRIDDKVKALWPLSDDE